MKLMMIAGELSGDTHGGSILSHLKKLVPGLEVFGVGGPRMFAQGLKSVIPLDNLQARGLVEVLRQLPSHYVYLRLMKKLLREERPDAVLLVDYPGFNLKIAKAAKQQGIPVFYYSGPQLWAWRGGRMREMTRWVDKIIVLFPFEVPLYHRAGVDAEFLGHPLVGVEATPKEVADFKTRITLREGLPVVAIMPGSRPGELERNLPTVLEGLRLVEKTGYRANYILPVASTLNIERVRELVRAGGIPVQVLDNAFLPLLQVAELAIVASGTATLQVGMAGIPFLVVYRVTLLTYRIAKAFLYIKDASIVNILAGRRIVPELVQRKFLPHRVCEEFLAIANDKARQQQIRADLAKVKKILGKPGAYGRAAERFAIHLQTLGKTTQKLEPAPARNAARSPSLH
ncbi:MAG: lipid-A-disaccharide synthase [SAR324 cluster bacterium]|nr:lipid-A-disaccharide synthase [SAR324 cluster bacterium]MCZ6645996.1 lipid-A-disaccharide synthase [SAR324 cluster bacterium]MCZ6841552.1 lipid-A-disaccharide synthase [SAR324 cluster bacterium]